MSSIKRFAHFAARSRSFSLFMMVWNGPCTHLFHAAIVDSVRFALHPCPFCRSVVLMRLMGRVDFHFWHSAPSNKQKIREI